MRMRIKNLLVMFVLITVNENLGKYFIFISYFQAKQH